MTRSDKYSSIFLSVTSRMPIQSLSRPLYPFISFYLQLLSTRVRPTRANSTGRVSTKSIAQASCGIEVDKELGQGIVRPSSS